MKHSKPKRKDPEEFTRIQNLVIEAVIQSPSPIDISIEESRALAASFAMLIVRQNLQLSPRQP